ncbi:hypothetical protein [Helicobacter sp. T3_23-1056]
MQNPLFTKSTKSTFTKTQFLQNPPYLTLQNHTKSQNPNPQKPTTQQQNLR